MRGLVALLATCLCFIAACPAVEETVDETEQASSTAVGVAEEMSEGTLGEVDVETGELPGEGNEDDTAQQDE